MQQEHTMAGVYVFKTQGMCQVKSVVHFQLCHFLTLVILGQGPRPSQNSILSSLKWGLVKILNLSELQ